MTDQNKYRCETCEFKGKDMMGDERCPYDTYKSNEDNCDLLYSFKRTEEEKKLIELCGLACHSDAKNIQCTVCGSEATHPHCDKCFGLAMENHRQDATEKVLNRLTDELNEMGCYGDVCCLEYFKKVVLELRKQGEQP